MKNLTPMATFLVLWSCLPSPTRDTLPPQLIRQLLDTGEDELVLKFNEPVGQARVEGDVTVPAVVTGNEVRAPIVSHAVPGQSYLWSAHVEDKSQNLTVIGGQYYGPNHSPARLRLNELRLVGSKDRPEFVELLAVDGGDCGGWTLDLWDAKGRHRRLVLASRSMAPDTYVVITFPGKAESPSRDVIPSGAFLVGADAIAWSHSRGIVSLRPAPDQDPVEVLAYGDSRIAALVASVGVQPTITLSTTGSSPTRTWNRPPRDGQWFLCPTGKATPGQENSSEVWEPSSPKSGRTATPHPRLQTNASSGVGPAVPDTKPTGEEPENGSDRPLSSGDEGEDPSAANPGRRRRPKPPRPVRGGRFARRPTRSDQPASGVGRPARHERLARRPATLEPMRQVLAGNAAGGCRPTVASRPIARGSLSLPTVVGLPYDPEDPQLGRDGPGRDGRTRKR